MVKLWAAARPAGIKASAVSSAIPDTAQSIALGRWGPAGISGRAGQVDSAVDLAPAETVISQFGSIRVEPGVNQFTFFISYFPR
jgi:hypothetical protein